MKKFELTAEFVTNIFGKKLHFSDEEENQEADK